ncbi:MAG: carbamoyltransferase HypF [Chloroflexota bacterium]
MTTYSVSNELVRSRLFVRGVVQGVGFRPHVYGLALKHGLTGFVGNDSEGVFIELEGCPTSIHAFSTELQNNPPPLAHIDSIYTSELDVQDSIEFCIVESQAHAGGNTLISPDLCICDDCLHEMQNPQNRRFRYPFINCTNCGPRFTIIKDVPYDRPMTTMADFTMCEACIAEYNDPLNRRFHAQPNACPDCGPQVTLSYDDVCISGDDAIQQTLSLIEAGKILAVKGVGGFHLVCDAMNNEAIALLRQRKRRAAKPFAIMVRDVEMAHELAHIDQHEAHQLTSLERPIVLLRKIQSKLSDSVAPNNPYIGVMLPYTPLHYLLCDRPLVMTSANYSTEPIIKDNELALTKLASVADAFLLHNREIHVHCDDSVIRIVDNAEYPIRRSRGFAPFPVKLPFSVPHIMAVGGELKSTFCLTKDDNAFMSQHIGDMENLEALQAFERAYQHMSAIYCMTPQMIVCDKHPRYLSTKWAETFAKERDVTLVKVQHHHAHIASVMAENGLQTPVIGFSYDGTGYGDDGAIWGSEVMIADYKEYKRIAHLPYMPLAGGDKAIKNPYRLALAYLWANNIKWDAGLPPVQYASDIEQGILKKQLERNLNVIQTSSMGRLFDVVASLIGIRQSISYEGQAAIEMEAHASETQSCYQFHSLRALLIGIIEDMKNMTSVHEIAGKFHNTIMQNIVTLSIESRNQYGISQVALSGGVFQNMLLLKATIQQLQAHDFDVFIHKQVPANDGGLALGQAMIASCRSKGENECV